MNYLRVTVCAYVGLLAGSSCYAQMNISSAVSYFNKSQQFILAQNLDSAVYCAEKLAVGNAQSANDLLHNTVAQYVKADTTSSADASFTSRFVRKLSAGSLPMQQAVYPLFRWMEAKQNLADSSKIHQVVTGLMVAQDRSPEEQGNRVDRYALLVYDLLKSKPAYSVLADTLINHTRQRLEHAVNGAYYESVNERVRKESRAYFRYLMAYSAFKKASEVLQRQDTVAAETYYKEAAQFAPDDNDRQVKWAYAYEAALLLNGRLKDGFQGEYANFLLAKGDTMAAVLALTEMAIADPGYINLLKTYYQKVPVSQLPFTDYWRQALNDKLKPTDDFHLTSLDNKIFDYKQLKGKWILIDFWGTWCKPCVEELPSFQKFYTDFAQTKSEQLIVLTAAGRDHEVKVKDFVAKHGYSFPVVMADESLIKQFRVDGYPTKVLITPQGKRMKIPFNTNWAERVKIYLAN